MKKAFLWWVYIIAIIEAELATFIATLADNTFSRLAGALGKAGAPLDVRYAAAAERSLVLLGILVWSARLIALSVVIYGFRVKEFTKMITFVFALVILLEAAFPNYWLYVFAKH